MYLYWYKVKKGKNNFGDELNPYIIGKLSGEKIKYLPIADTKIRRIIKAFLRFFKLEISFSDFCSVFFSLIAKNYFVGIGSTIQWVGGRNCHIWGAGIIRKDTNIKSSNFYVVRGEVTRNKIIELGYRRPAAIGDPALILPVIYTPKSKKAYELGIIPHFVNYNEVVPSFAEEDNILLIDVLNEPKHVIEQINMCEKTISSSLHGIIVSQAYGIPSLWGKIGINALAGDNVKFDDYFSSVGITSYEPINLDLSNKIIDQAKSLFIINKDKTLIKYNLEVIQEQLLNNAPFKVLKLYKDKLCSSKISY